MQFNRARILLAKVWNAFRGRSPTMVLLWEEAITRESNLAAYDLNIDRYRRMLRAIASKPGDMNMKGFADELRGRLDAERGQRAREQLILDAVHEQLKDLGQ